MFTIRNHLLSSASLSIFISSTDYTESCVSPYAIFSGLALFVPITYYMKMIIKWDHNYMCFETLIYIA